MKQLFFIICVLFALNSAGQSIKFRFDGTLTNIDAGKKEGGVSVSIVQNGATLYNTTTSSNGKYVLSGDINYSIPFDVVFAKGGFVSKRVSFNFVGLNEEDTPSGSEYKPVSDLSIDIFGVRPNVDFSFLDTQPVASFNWNKSKFAADPDQSQIAKMRTKIDKLLLEAEKNAANAEAKYNAAIAEADKLYGTNSYEGALAKYEEALAIKPKEKHPANRILELDALIQKNKAAELAEKQENAEYYNLIQAADNFRNAKDYDKAKAKYQEALSKKDEQYPKDEIKKIDSILKEKENEAAYKAAVDLGDMMLKQKSYKAARDKYTEASKLKPSEQYPKTKLAELDAMIKQQEDLAANKKKYEDAIAAGDKLFTEEKWEDSKTKYKEALAIESASNYASGRIKLIDETLAKLKADKEKEAQITKLLGEGASAQLGKKYPESLAKYKEVLTLDAQNAIALAKITELEKIIADEKLEAAKDAEFLALVKKGDDAIVAKKLESAITNYEAAIVIKKDPAVQAKLADAQKQLADLKNAEQLNADFTKLMAEGKTAFDSKNYDQALSKYESAKALKPADKNPQAKIDEINTILSKLADENKKNENIAKLLAEGQVLITSKSWEQAKTKYNEVLTLASTHETAKAKLKEIDAAILAMKEQADKDAKFAEFVEKGDADALADKGTLAITNYKSALQIKNDAAVQQKIDALQAKLDAAAANKALDLKYQTAITEADKLFGEKKYSLAKEKYSLAKGLKPSETYPVEKINAIDALMAKELADKEKADQIKKLLDEGASLLSAKKYENAKTKYESVLAIDNSNATAQAKLNEINAALAGLMDQAAKDKEFNALKAEGLSLFSQNQLNPAKTKLSAALQIKDDSEVKAKIAEIDAALKAIADKAAKIEGLLSEGQKLYDAKKLPDAKSKYVAVLGLDTENAEAKSKIASIDAALAQQMNAEQQTAQFEKFKKEGFDLATAKKWTQAKSKLEEALAIKDDSGVRQKIAEIDSAIAAENSAELKEKQYQDLITSGQQFIDSKSYQVALDKFKQATVIKPNEQLPKNKIAEINELIKNSSKNSELDAKYLALIENGDKKVQEKDYITAISLYNEALALKPTEPLPVEKAKKAQALADEVSRNQNDVQYEKILSTISEKIETNDFTRAKELIDRALTLRPDDNRPKTLLKEIQDIEKRNADFKLLMTQGQKEGNAKNYEKAINTYEQAKALIPSNPEPEAKIAALRKEMDSQNKTDEKDQLFITYVSNGDASAATQNYDVALNNYQNALNIKPSHAPTIAKIKEIQRKLDELANDKARSTELQNEFNKVIKEADGFFNSESYPEAIDRYKKALLLIPTNTYAQQQLVEAQNRSSKMSIKEVEKEYKKILSTADRYMQEANYTKASELYNRAISLRSSDPYPKKKLEEIDAILNPVSQTSAELLPLGEVYDNSIMDGTTALALAEVQRKNLKSSKMKNRLDEIGDAENEMSTKKKAENLETSNEIYTIYRNVSIDSKERDLNRLALVEALRAEEVSRLSQSDIDNSFEHSSVVITKGYLTEIEKESALDYGIRESVYTDNSDKLGVIKISAVDKNNALASNYYANNIESDGKLNEITSKYNGDYVENQDKRIAEGRKVEVVRIKATNQMNEINTLNYDENLATKESLNKVVSNSEASSYLSTVKQGENHTKLEIVANNATIQMNEINTLNYDENIATKKTLSEAVSNSEASSQNSAMKQGENHLKLEKVAHDATNQMNEINTLNYDENIATKQKLNEVVSNSEATAQKSTIKQAENHTKLEKIAHEATVQMDGNSKTQKDKVVAADQSFIDLKENISVDETSRKGNRLENVAYVNQIDKKATITSNEFKYSDEQERLGSQTNIDFVKSNQSIKSAEEVEKLKGNSTSMDDINKSINAGNANAGYDKKNQLLDTQKAVDGVDNTPKDKVVIANSLGEEYPEGVSQEVFQRKDENGIMNAIITRRIVVYQGKGDVYVKTQSLDAITYSKNGKSTTEYVWQNETQASHLERHY